jgi:RimJ/RimL family protein N-acetyltransferase
VAFHATTIGLKRARLTNRKVTTVSVMNALLDPAPLGFRPTGPKDLPLLHEWMKAPHARRWFGSRYEALDQVIAEYTKYFDGTVPIHSFIVTYAGAPIGLMEWARFGDFPEMMEDYRVDDPQAVNCDVLIGDAQFIHRGLGKPMIIRFLREQAFRDARHSLCFIDPETENTIAIRAYEKAGFHFVRDVTDEDGLSVHLMELTRAEL